MEAKLKAKPKFVDHLGFCVCGVILGCVLFYAF